VNPAIESRKRQLDAYFARAVDPRLPEEIQSDLAKHGTILICGFIERSVENVIMDHVTSRSQPRIASFIKGHFRRGTNYDCEAIAQLLDRFDVAWGDKFRTFKGSRDDIVQAVNSAYELRNSIAHGGTANRGIRGVIDLFKAAKEAVDALDSATT
jgi:hypothetical protein